MEGVDNTRNRDMHIENFPELKSNIEKAYGFGL